MKPLHILHSEAAFGWGGQEIRIFQECRELLKRGHRVTLVCQPGSPLAERGRTLTDDNYAFHPLRMRRPLSPSAFFKLLRLIRRARPDVLHTHSSIDSWLVSFIGKILGIPIVRTRHVSIPVKNYFPNNQLYSFFPARILTSGAAIRDMLLKVDGVKEDRVVSIPAGVDMQRFDYNLSGEKIRQELNLSEGQPLIGKVGVIRGWKGHDYFLESAPLVLKQFPNARFVIVGDGPGYDEIRRKVQQRGLDAAVTLLGHREDVPEIIAAMDIMVLASFAGEGTSQVIPQAFAMKTPVVAARGGSIAELLGNEERGLLADIKSGPSLASGVVRLLQDSALCERFKAEAYAYCERELTIERKMEQTLSVYRDVLNRSDNAS